MKYYLMTKIELISEMQKYVKLAKQAYISSGEINKQRYIIYNARVTDMLKQIKTLIK